MSAFHSAVTTITQNLPSFISDPAKALIGERCYDILIFNFNITHVDCLKYAISKGLGLGIVLGGAIVKIPQIVTIVSTRSARGLSLSAYILETLSYGINLAYASRSLFPFSTYGENFFLTIQNVIITLLITLYSGSADSHSLSGPTRAQNGDATRKLVTGLVSVVAIGGFLYSSTLCPPALLAILQALTVPLSLSSKAPQILTNYRHRSTGNLSAFAVFNALLGCLARLFTTKQEVNDPLIFWGFAGAAILNTVLAAQMVQYWKTSAQDVAPLSAAGVEKIREAEGGDAVPLKTALDDGSAGRRFTRKLD